MPTIVKLKNSVTTSAAPTSLTQGEVAVNVTDKKVWVGNAATTPVQILGAGATVSGTDLAYTGTLTGGTGVVNLGSGQFYKDASGNVGIGTSSPVYQNQIYGSGQITAALTDAGNKGGSLLLNTPLTAGGDGGALLIGASGSGAKPFAAVKGLLTDSANNTLGDLAFSTRNASTDTALTERMRIAAGGNVGIGTSSPSYKLQVGSFSGNNTLEIAAGTTGESNLFFGDGSTGTDPYRGYLQYQHTSDALIIATSATERMRIDSSGNVGIGTSSPGRQLAVQAATGVSAGVRLGNTAQAWDIETGTTDVSLRFVSAAQGAERMRIDSSGNLLVGTTTRGIVNSNSFNIDISSLTMYYNHANGISSGQSYAEFGYNTSVIGSIKQTGTTGVLYNVTSDYRLKTVIAPVSDSGTRLDALQPIEYDWKAGGRTRGFLAHQFAEVYPDSVSGEKDAVDKDGKPVYQAMQASSPEVMADLIAEIQSLRKRVAQLEGN